MVARQVTIGKRIRWRSRRATAVGLIVVAVLAGACGSKTHSATTSTTTPARSSPASTRVSGTANVAYAGSLQLLNEKVLGPAFSARTGAKYQGRGGGAIGLSNEIAAGEISPNVFESIGGKPITALEPKLTSWYVQLAASPIVVAYNPNTSFAAQLKAIADGTKSLSDLFTLMATPGFTLGRTNPNTDPQGQAFYEMVELAQSTMHLPAGTAQKLLGPLDNPSQVFAETALESRLQAGQLDAASAFLSQAIQLHLPYITLPSSINFGNPALASTYATASLTLTGGQVVHGVPLVVDVTTLGHTDSAAADAFVAYLLSPPARAAFKTGGYELLTPTVFGNKSTVPAEVRHELAA